MILNRNHIHIFTGQTVFAGTFVPQNELGDLDPILSGLTYDDQQRIKAANGE